MLNVYGRNGKRKRLSIKKEAGVVQAEIPEVVVMANPPAVVATIGTISGPVVLLIIEITLLRAHPARGTELPEILNRLKNLSVQVLRTPGGTGKRKRSDDNHH